MSLYFLRDNFLPRKEEIVSQSNTIFPHESLVAPSISFKEFISELGPIIRVVPVSAMA